MYTTYHQASCVQGMCLEQVTVTDSAECAWLGKGYSCRHTVSTDTCKHACMNKQSSTYRQALTTHFAMCALDSVPRSPSIHASSFFFWMPDHWPQKQLLKCRPRDTKRTGQISLWLVDLGPCSAPRSPSIHAPSPSVFVPDEDLHGQNVVPLQSLFAT